MTEAAGNAEAFDYMDLMETQYSQLYAMMSLPPFDPSMTVKTGIPNYMVPMPNGMFRAPVVVPTVPPPSGLNVTNMPHPGVQAAAAAAQAATMEKRFRGMNMNSPPQMNQPPPPVIPNRSNASQQPAAAPLTSQSDSRPDSVASSLTSTIPPTPTNLLSPNPGIPMAPFNQAARPMPVVPNPQAMYPLMAAPFPGMLAPMQPVVPEIKNVLCKQM